MEQKKRVAVILLLLLLLGGSVWAWRLYSQNKLYNDLKDQALALANEGGGPETYQDIQEIRDQIPISYLQSYDQSLWQNRDNRDLERMRAFFAMTPAEQNSELDRRIAEEERRAKQFEAMRAEREARNAASGRGQGNGNSSRGGGQNAGGNGNSTGGGGQAGGQGGPGGGGRNRTLSARLDRTTPEMRAMRAAFHVQMNQRRSQLGMPPSRRGGRMML